MKFLSRCFRSLAGRISWIGGIALALSLAAEPMKPGAYSFNFTPPVNIWDISGDYFLAADGFDCRFTLNVDSGGKITGNGTGTLEDGQGRIEATLTYKGMVKSAGTATRVTLVLTVNGRGHHGANDLLFTGSLKRTWEIDPISGLVLGKSGGKLKVGLAGKGSKSLTIPTTDEVLALPGALMGNWRLDLNVQTNSTAYLGDGTLRLANGTDLPMLISGSYSAKRGTSTLIVGGSTLAQGIRLAVVTAATNSQVTLQSLTGKALGQKISWKPSP